MRHNLLDGKTTEFIAAEPDSCPKLTRGQFRYDFGDEAGYTPLLPMYTLGHNFKPSNIHAGGLRYHGAGMIISQLIKDGLMHGVDIPQLETFEAGMLFARTEGIIPAPESTHAIAATIREAKKCKETGRTHRHAVIRGLHQGRSAELHRHRRDDRREPCRTRQKVMI